MPNQTNDFEEWEWLRVGMGKEGTSQSPPRLNLNLTHWQWGGQKLQIRGQRMWSPLLPSSKRKNSSSYYRTSKNVKKITNAKAQVILFLGIYE